MKLPHWVLVLLSFLTVALSWILAEVTKGDIALPAQALAEVSTALQLVNMAIGLTTDSVQSNVAKKRALAAASGVTGLILFAFLGVLAVASMPACASNGGFPAISNLETEVSNVEQIVAKDLAAGESDDQIAADVCKTLGGSDATVATCGDIPTVVADIVKALLDTGVLKNSPTAVANAKAYLARHPFADAGADAEAGQ